MHIVKDVLDISFSVLELNWEKYVEFDKSLTRKAEPSNLVGNYSKAYDEILGWEPKLNFVNLISEMTLLEFNSLKSATQEKLKHNEML